MATPNTKQIAQRLINEHRPGIIQPEVLCVGPQKTGTTWLYINLKKHPQVWAPPIKELRYWAEGYSIPSHTLKHLVFSSHYHYAQMRKALRMKFQRILSPQHPDRLFDESTEWLLRYVMGRRSDEWYGSLFPQTPLHCIDVSPIYYELSKERIKQLAAYNPNAKIIMMVRNPIDRVWSLARMTLCVHQSRSVEQVERSEFIRLFAWEYKHWKPYCESIALWQDLFRNVHVGYYDALQSDGAHFFKTICTFLHLNEEMVPDTVNQQIHQGIEGALPLEFRHLLFDQYGKEIQEMADRGIIPAHKWLGEHQAIINGEA